MPACITRFVCILGGCFSLLLLAASANAQCGVNTTQFDNIGLVPGNPFQGENKTVSILPARRDAEPHTRTATVARDGQGRVRVERSAGSFVIDTGAEAGTKEEDRIIMICDPVSQTLTQLDTLNKTARIRHAQPSAKSLSASHDRTFCSRVFPFNGRPNMQTEDLGHQTRPSKGLMRTAYASRCSLSQPIQTECPQGRP